PPLRESFLLAGTACLFRPPAPPHSLPDTLQPHSRQLRRVRRLRMRPRMPPLPPDLPPRQRSSLPHRRVHWDANWHWFATPATAAESSSPAGSPRKLLLPSAIPTPPARQSPLRLPMDSPPGPAADKSSDSPAKQNTPELRRWSWDRRPPPRWLVRPNLPASDEPAPQTICCAAPDKPGSQSSLPAAPKGLRAQQSASGSTAPANCESYPAFGTSFISQNWLQLSLRALLRNLFRELFSRPLSMPAASGPSPAPIPSLQSRVRS